MELVEAMRTTGTCRYFTDEAVPGEVLYKAFDSARSGPQGGNRQPVRWIVVRDQAKKQRLAELYLPYWDAYFNAIAGGGGNVGALPEPVTSADHFARHLAEHPALVIACAEIEGLHVTDADLDRVSVVGGARSTPPCRTSAWRSGTRESAAPSPPCSATRSPRCASCCTSPTASSPPATS